MRSSGYLWHEGLARHLARAHDEQGSPLAVRKYTSADAARYGSMGGLLTTATDHARFLIAIMDPKPADAYHLNEPSMRELLTPQVKVEEGPGYSISWARGWRVAKTVDFCLFASPDGGQ